MQYLFVRIDEFQHLGPCSTFGTEKQEMTSQQRAVAKSSLDALASARALAGLRNLGEGAEKSENCHGRTAKCLLM